MTKNSSGASEATVVAAEDYLKGAAFSPEQTLELVKCLKRRIGSD